MLLSNAVEQCYRAMLRFFPEQMHVRTDGTNEELLTLGTSSYVEQRAQGGCKNQSHLGSKRLVMGFVTPALVRFRSSCGCVNGTGLVAWNCARCTGRDRGIRGF